MTSVNGHAIEVLGAELRALRDLMDEREKTGHERDRRYEDRAARQDTAVTAALAANKELTAAAFAASEKAIVKAEDAQKSYNAGHNDLSRKLETQTKESISRLEHTADLRRVDEKLDEIKKELQNLRDARSIGAGKDEAHASTRLDVKWVIALALGLVGPLAAFLMFLSR